ncbi:hypothetical protein PMAYCL1PPCAC_02291, partial [Pristionchus mayeri]
QYLPARNRVETSAVVLHCEQSVEDSFEHRFECGSLDDFLVEVFIVTSITMKHFNENKEMADLSADSLLRLMRLWPRKYQVLDEGKIMARWKKCFTCFG